MSALLLVVYCSIALGQSSDITIQALNGKSGKPMVHQRLVIFGGKTAPGASFQQTHFDVTTDDRGFANLAYDPATTLWIEVFADFQTLCHNKPNLVQFSVEQILRGGLSSPNNCSSITAERKPGQFTVFARPATRREKKAW
jgi:hypothetical protein